MYVNIIAIIILSMTSLCAQTSLVGVSYDVNSGNVGFVMFQEVDMDEVVFNFEFEGSRRPMFRMRAGVVYKYRDLSAILYMPIFRVDIKNRYYTTPLVGEFRYMKNQYSVFLGCEYEFNIIPTTAYIRILAPFK